MNADARTLWRRPVVAEGGPFGALGGHSQHATGARLTAPANRSVRADRLVYSPAEQAR
jgi:hypothetical protein